MANILESVPIQRDDIIDNKKIEYMGKFTIDDISKPFVFHDIVPHMTSETFYPTVFSAWVKSEQDGEIIIGREVISTTDTWEHIEIPIVNFNAHFVIRFNEIGIYYFACNQLEVGTKATDYKLAEEDSYSKHELVSEILQTSSTISLAIKDLTDGRFSTIEQDVNSITGRVSDAEGNISTLTQTVDGFDTRIENVEGDVSTLSQTVDGFETRIETAEGNVSTLTQNVNSITGRITTAEGNISTVQQTINGLEVTTSGGSTYIYGNHIKTGKISSVNGLSYFDLDTGYIKANTGSFSGTIEADEGNIGDWHIDDGELIATGTLSGNIGTAIGLRSTDIMFTYTYPDTSFSTMDLCVDGIKFTDRNTQGVVTRETYLSSRKLETEQINAHDIVAHGTTANPAILSVELGSLFSTDIYAEHTSSGTLAGLRCTHGDMIHMPYTGMVLIGNNTETASTTFRPVADNAMYLGDNGRRWKQLWAVSGTINTSDRKAKDVLSDFDWSKNGEFIDRIQPVAYHMINGDGNGRVHMGVIAQQVSEVCNEIEFGDMSLYQAYYNDGTPYWGELVDDSELNWGVNYSEFIAPIIIELQSLRKRIKELEEERSGF